MVDRPHNQVRRLRLERGWTQELLAQRAVVSRAAVGAIEQRRLTPSVDAAIRIAAALDRRVKEVFGTDREAPCDHPRWAWLPRTWPARYWRAWIGDRLLHYPVEPTALGLLPHDGVAAHERDTGHADTPARESQRTLVIATCDPAASLLCSAFAQRSGFRPICLNRTSAQSLQLLGEGLVHLAGVHLARAAEPRGNAAAVNRAIGADHELVHVAHWDAGIAVAGTAHQSIRALRKARLRWIGRVEGSGARGCQDEVLGSASPPRRIALSHRGVVEALRSGWAQAGACLQLVADEAGLSFIPVRREAYDLCLRRDLAADPRIAGFIETIRSPRYRQLIEPLPGYAPAPDIGELAPV